MYQTYKITKKLVFIIIDYKGPRFLSKNMKSHYVNGGFTFLNSDHIYIFRYKEYPKVIIHEIFHHIYHNFYCNDKFLFFKFGFHINVYESIIEFLATIQHLKFISHNHTDFLSKLKKEIQHSYSLSQYILDIQNDDTNVKSYILLKYILLLHHTFVLKNIHNPCKIYDILLQFDMNKIIKKKIPKKFKFNFMIFSDL